MVTTTILFDLDGTLVVEFASAKASVLATFELARTQYDLDLQRLYNRYGNMPASYGVLPQPLPTAVRLV